MDFETWFAQQSEHLKWTPKTEKVIKAWTLAAWETSRKVSFNAAKGENSAIDLLSRLEVDLAKSKPDIIGIRKRINKTLNKIYNGG